jgi:4-diphosphocytidyl-2-methyl-D-erithritol synthase
MIMKRYAIVVAGGNGMRMGAHTPKQFLVIGRKPILMHTIQQFFIFDPSIKIIVVLPNDQIKHWESLCEQYNFNVQHQITFGGSTRFHSVKNGLALIKETDALVAIHDGVRPFVAIRTLSNCYQMAAKLGNSIPVIEAFESVRLSDDEGNRAIDRNTVKLVQTPQVFIFDQLAKAYTQPQQPFFTDDASVVEEAGFEIHLTDGNRENIKITTPFDLKIAEMLLQ